MILTATPKTTLTMISKLMMNRVFVVHRRVAAPRAPRVRKRKTTLSGGLHLRTSCVISFSLSYLLLSLSRFKSSRKRTTTTYVYLGYHTNPKHCFFFVVQKKFVSRVFFSRLASLVSQTHTKKRRRTMNTSGGGTTREHQQQTQGNQAVVGSGDTVVPTTQFSSKQSKTSTVTITGGLILYHRPCSFFELRSLSLSFFNLSPLS